MARQLYSYPARIRREDGEFIVSFPDFPEALTGADNEAEALDLAADALEEAVLGRLADGMEIPRPHAAAAGEVDILLEPVTAARAAISRALKSRKLSKTALAKLMHRDEKVARRILDGRGEVELKTAMEALDALGQSAGLVVEEREVA